MRCSNLKGTHRKNSIRYACSVRRPTSVAKRQGLRIGVPVFLAQREGYSPMAKIFRLAAYERARCALRLKCEPCDIRHMVRFLSCCANRKRHLCGCLSLLARQEERNSNRVTFFIFSSASSKELISIESKYRM